MDPRGPDEGASSQESEEGTQVRGNEQEEEDPDYAEHRAALVAMYEQVDPSKVDTVDLVLGRYEGRELELWVKLKKKYGDAAVPPASFIEDKPTQDAADEPVVARCFGRRESPGERQKRLQDEAQKKREQGRFVFFCNALFGSAPEGMVPRQYPWLTICYTGCGLWCLCATYILLLYGTMFQAAEGQSWLISIVLSLSLDVFIQEPAKLLILGSVLSMWQLYKRSSKKSIRDAGMSSSPFGGFGTGMGAGAERVDPRQNNS